MRLTRLGCKRCEGTSRDRDGQLCPECEQVDRWLNEIAETMPDLHESEGDTTEAGRSD